VNVHELRDAESVRAQLGGCSELASRSLDAKPDRRCLEDERPASGASMGRGWLLCLDSLSRLGNGQYQERC
jgi:hypothetical protein